MKIKDFDEFINICHNYSTEQLQCINYEKSKNKKRKEYLQFCKRESFIRSKSVKERIRLLCGRNNNQFKEWFSWSQCENPLYDKYYKLFLKDIYFHVDNYKKVYDLLWDEGSRKCFYALCMWRLTMESKYLVKAYSESYREQYFEEFEKLRSSEIFVDCGGFIGDTTNALLNYRGGVKKVYFYEADAINMRKAKENLSFVENVIFRNVGVGSKHETLCFSGLGLSSSSFSQDGNGEKTEVIPIDEDISSEEKITFMKMDIEGMEMKALYGAKNHIREDRPVLAICVYHRVEDLWEIPMYIYKLVKHNYKFYLRHYTLYHGETVFYAVPDER